MSDTDVRPRMARRAAIGSFIGTTIEWYDFFIYGTAAALVFNTVFFPALSGGWGLVASFATFWVGFLARPLGAIIFGHFGDRAGRKTSLVVTLLLAGGATTAIGLLPTAESIGIMAPLLLLLMRMIQGVAVGGEWGGAVLLASENAPKARRVVYAAIPQVGAPSGLLLSTVSFWLLQMLPEDAFLTWGWRIPFLASGVLLVIGLVIRTKIDESPVMQDVIRTQSAAKLPLKEVLATAPGRLLLGIGACVIGGSAIYFHTTFAMAWATNNLGYEVSAFLALTTGVTVISLIAMPVSAQIAARIGLKRMMLIALLSQFVTLPLMFALINTHVVAFAALGMALATISNCMNYSVVPELLMRAFPPRLRYTGVSLAYQLAGAIFIGTSPMIAQYLLGLTNSIVPVVVFAVLQILLTLVCTLVLLRVTSASGTAEPGASATPRCASPVNAE